jgi:hypothetical protein
MKSKILFVFLFATFACFNQAQASDVVVSDVEGLDLSAQSPTQTLASVEAVLEGRVWASASAQCVQKGMAYAVRSEEGIVFEVLHATHGSTLVIGAFGKFDCRK